MGHRRGRLRIGTSGFAYAHWSGLLYPPGLPKRRWLDRYAEVFSTLEVNATFYRLQTPETFERWRRETPEGFVFACKGSRYLTHMKRLTDTGRGLDRFFGPALALKEKLGPVLWQLPPQMIDADLARLDAFLGALPARVRKVVEFRSEGWYTRAVCDVLEAHGAAFCEHDLVDRRPPRFTGGFRYLRFHGNGAKYAGRYGRATLRSTARSLKRSLGQGVDAYVYFNNDGHGHALYDARDLSIELGVPLPLALPEERLVE